MRVLIVDTCYEAFLRSHYGRDPGLAERPYEAQWRALMDTFFGTADAYSHFLGEIGHPAHEVIVNCEPLQRAWAREHEVAAVGEQVLLAQVEDFQPDVVYLQNLHVLSDTEMDALKRSGTFVAGQIASEAPPVGRLRMFDLLLTSFPHFVEEFRASGVDAEYFRIGFDPRVLERLGAVPVEHDVSFVGALNGIRHRRGNATLARAARRLPVEFWGYDLRGRPPWSPLRRRYRGEAWGIDMFRVLASSRVVLNRHIGVAREYANNMRLYEATGVGSLLATDSKANLADLFEPGSEVVAYRDADDLVAQVQALLADEEARREIAAAGQARTLRDHTYAVRMRELAEILEGRLR
jgi:glycosyltransferase involved in cell wall biosynthesis